MAGRLLQLSLTISVALIWHSSGAQCLENTNNRDLLLRDILPLSQKGKSRQHDEDMKNVFHREPAGQTSPPDTLDLIPYSKQEQVPT